MDPAALIVDDDQQIADSLFSAVKHLTALGRTVHAAHADALSDAPAFVHALNHTDRQLVADRVDSKDPPSADPPSASLGDALPEIEMVSQSLMRAARHSLSDYRPAIFESLAMLGAALSNMQRYAAASRMYEFAVGVYQHDIDRLSPDICDMLVGTLNNLGVSRLRAGDADGAIQAFHDSIQLIPKEDTSSVTRNRRARVWHNLCIALIVRRRFQEAHEAWRESAMLRAEIAREDAQTGELQIASCLTVLAVLLKLVGRRHASMTVAAEVEHALNSNHSLRGDLLRMFLLGLLTANDQSNDAVRHTDAPRANSETQVERTAPNERVVHR